MSLGYIPTTPMHSPDIKTRITQKLGQEVQSRGTEVECWLGGRKLPGTIPRQCHCIGLTSGRSKHAVRERRAVSPRLQTKLREQTKLRVSTQPREQHYLWVVRPCHRQRIAAEGLQRQSRRALLPGYKQLQHICKLSNLYFSNHLNV